MKQTGVTLIEGAVMGGLVLVLAVPMFLGVLDTRRRSRDAERLSGARQIQAALETYRAGTSSYPASADALRSDDAELARAFHYQALPENCGADRAMLCHEYRLTFTLEGAIGMLAGGTCTAGLQGFSCSL